MNFETTGLTSVNERDYKKLIPIYYSTWYEMGSNTKGCFKNDSKKQQQKVKLSGCLLPIKPSIYLKVQLLIVIK